MAAGIIDDTARHYSNGIYVYATRIGKGAGDLVPCFLICMLLLKLYQSQPVQTSLPI